MTRLPFSNRFVALCLVLAGVCTAHADNIGGGHLTIRSLSPGHLLRPNVSLGSIPDLPPRRLRTTVSVDWGNVWIWEPDNYLLDGEWYHAAARFTYSFTEDLQATLAVPVVARTGGFADRLVEDFHDIVGLSNAGRESYPRDNVVIAIETGEEAAYVNDEPSRGIGDVPLMVSWKLTPGDERIPAVALQLGMTFPTGDEDEFEGIGTYLFGGGVIASKRLPTWDRIIVFGGASVSYADRTEFQGIELIKEEYSGMVGLLYEWCPRTDWLAQYTVTSPFAREFHGLSAFTYELNVGFRRALNERSLLECSVTENMIRFDNSTDIGLHLAVTTQF
jgi:hypothetical protein